MPSKTAKLFNNGGSQAVRLPAEFRFEGSEVLVRRDKKTGDVILSPKPKLTWAEYFKHRDAHKNDIPADFMSERPLNNEPFQVRNLFDDRD